MSKITRHEDAESILGLDEADEMERRARLVGKSDTDDGGELHPAMVTKAATKIGSFIRRKREEKEMSITDLAAKTPVTDDTIGDIENGTIKTPSAPVIKAIARAIGVNEKQLDDLLPSSAEPAEVVAKNKGDLAALIPENEVDTTKAGHMKPGEHMRQMRRRKKMKRVEVAKQLGLEDRELELLETDEDEENKMDIEMMSKMADVLKATEEEKEELLARFGKKRRKEPPIHKGATNLEDSEIPTAKMPETFSAIAYDNLLAENGTKMDYDGHGQVEIGMSTPLLGGATSLKEADAYIQAQEKMDKMYSYWDMLQIAFHNIKRDEEIPDKLKAVSSLFREMAGKIDTLKAGLSDAFLIQESAAAYDDYEDAEDDLDRIQSDEVNTMNENEIIHPADQLKATIDTALGNEALTGADRETVVQEAFNEFAQDVQAQLQAADPASQADQIATAIKGALAEVFTPLSEQVALLTAKMGSVETPQPQGVTQLHEVYVPQQKSMMAPPVTPQPIQAASGLRISPITGKPSRLRDMVEKSVGMVT